MLKKPMILVLALVLSGAIANAQAPKAAAKSPAAAAEEKAKPAPAKLLQAPEPPPLPLNIRIEVSITDQSGSNPAAKKVVSMIAGDHQSTNIRSSASVPVKMAGSMSYNYRNVTINVDARPFIVQKEPNKINVSFGLEYFPKGASGQEEMEPGMASWSERLGLILESGKPMMISQAADPTSDRKITVEVTATILK